MKLPKYTIISLNDDRAVFKEAITRNTSSLYSWSIPAVDGRAVDLPAEIEKRGLELSHHWGNPKLGELGVWLSNFDRWEKIAGDDYPSVVFEDDAIVSPAFTTKLALLMNELPDDWDFVALWVPEDQRIDYRYAVVYELGIPRINGVLPDHVRSLFDFGAHRAALVYQGYGMVSLMYSPTGAAKLVDLARKHGITGPVDCWIYEQAHMGNVNGYAPKPEFADIVSYDWSATSHVQLTERLL